MKSYLSHGRRLSVIFFSLLIGMAIAPIKSAYATGTIHSVAGAGEPGFLLDTGLGDGGLAINAGIYQPDDVAVDSEGNLYIADTQQDLIRKVAASTGIITTIAGSTVIAPDGRGFSGDGGLATEAMLCLPTGLALNEGNLYFADNCNDRIRKIDLTTGIITTVVGKDSNYGNEFDVNYGGDGGPAVDALLDAPQDVAFDSSGNLYLTDWINNRVRKVDKTTKIITTIAGTGTGPDYCNAGTDITLASEATDMPISPLGLAFDNSGDLYVTNNLVGCVLKLNLVDENPLYKNKMIRVAGTGSSNPSDALGFSGDGGPATSAKLFTPSFITFDGSGNLYIADSNTCRVRQVNTSNIINTIAGNNNLVDSIYPGVKECEPDFSGDGGDPLMAKFAPTAVGFGIALGPTGNLFIADGSNNRVREVCYSSEGCLIGFTAPSSGGNDGGNTGDGDNTSDNTGDNTNDNTGDNTGSEGNPSTGGCSLIQ